LLFNHNNTTLDTYRVLRPNAHGEFRARPRHPRSLLPLTAAALRRLQLLARKTRRGAELSERKMSSEWDTQSFRGVVFNYNTEAPDPSRLLSPDAHGAIRVDPCNPCNPWFLFPLPLRALRGRCIVSVQECRGVSGIRTSGNG